MPQSSGPHVWRNSSRSVGASGAGRVEVSALPAAVAIRDSQRPGEPLTAERGEWTALLAAIRHDAL